MNEEKKKMSEENVFDLASNISEDYERKSNSDDLEKKIKEELVIPTSKAEKSIRDSDAKPENYIKVFKKLYEENQASEKQFKAVKYVVEEINND